MLIPSVVALVLMSADIGEIMRANQDALQMYTHKRRTEITYKDNTRTRVDEVRYVDGVMKVTPVSGGGGQGDGGQRRKAGPLARKRVEKKVREMREDAQELVAALQQYLQPSEKSQLTWDEAAQLPSPISIRKDLKGGPATIQVTFARLPDGGPFYASTATVEQPKKKLTIRVENFDYVK
ncbi:hypothetical protein F183_A53440 [Bryobacterales bacterium F-183]|nr:hypothetical protein F183_A53440 [Bryobacterales bacterium F-183]